MKKKKNKGSKKALQQAAKTPARAPPEQEL